MDGMTHRQTVMHPGDFTPSPGAFTARDCGPVNWRTRKTLDEKAAADRRFLTVACFIPPLWGIVWLKVVGGMMKGKGND